MLLNGYGTLKKTHDQSILTNENTLSCRDGTQFADSGPNTLFHYIVDVPEAVRLR